MVSRFSRLASLTCVLAAVWLAAAPAARAACGELVYSFQPDCYQPKGDGACGQTIEHLDFGPQIAVWIETADRTLVDTLMVTSLTATRGIGNRPGIWNFRSAPKFPYGKRWMALPLWAYARGKLFDTVVMQDDREDWMGFHEAHSSPETFFCRPLSPTDVNLNVDVVTCPSTRFNSAKGRLDPSTRSYYPPRNDLTQPFQNEDCDHVGELINGDPKHLDPVTQKPMPIPPCNVSARSYAALNDLDAIAAATPPYGRVYARTWHVPTNLPPGDYAVVVEVNKEYDTNAAHAHMAFQDPNLPSYGIDGNFGQPSVLYRVPVHLGADTPSSAVVSEIAGYSKWTEGAPLDGTLLPRDVTISKDVPGSGEMRLVAYDGPGGNGRVHVVLQGCTAGCDGDGGCGDGSAGDADASTDGMFPGCAPLPSLPGPVLELATSELAATSATVSFLNAIPAGGQVDSYEVRYRVGTSLTEDEFQSADPGPFVTPGAPGQLQSFVIPDLKPAMTYVVGVRTLDRCGQHSALATTTFQTPTQKFTQLSGCFVATAAYGSVLEPEVATLRRARDRLRAGSPLFAAASDLYYRSGPAAAAVVANSDVARGLARRIIGPFAGLAEALDSFGGRRRAGVGRSE